ncbi:hypothetical protein MMC26_003696 [Xylographa opegraphella]|nr:hypothetical protein [Xylographa opegraphella]
MAPTNPPKRLDDQEVSATVQDTAHEHTWQIQNYTHSRSSSVPREDVVVLDTEPPLSRSQKRRRNRARHNTQKTLRQGAPSAAALKLAASVKQRAENISSAGQAQKTESGLDNTSQPLKATILRGYLLPQVHKADSNHKSKTTNRGHSKIFFCIAEPISEPQDQDNTMDWTSSDMSSLTTLSPSLLGMSLDIRKQIFGYVLVSDHNPYMYDDEDEFEFTAKDDPSDRTVIPYYKAFDGDRPSERIYGPPWNKDVSILRVNKQLYKEASAVLYGDKHQFVLNDAKIAQWWTTQLGDTMKIVTTLVIQLDAGLSHLCVPRERLWLNLFRYLAKHQTLKYLAISFAGWDDALGIRRYGDDEWTRDCAIRARNDTIECLYTIRGLKHVIIAPWDYMSDEAAEELCGYMVAKDGVVHERTLKAQAIERKKRDTPLARLLATLPH